MAKSRPKKPKKALVKKRLVRAATTRSTAGPGFTFEDQVAAWLLIKMLRGEPMPGTNAPAEELKMQTGALGWDIDDLLASSPTDPAPPRRLAVSCKSNVQVTSSGLPAEFVSAAWRLWRKPEPLRRGFDCFALVTRGRNASFDSTWSDLKGWCADGDVAFAIAKINASEKHKKVYASVKAPADNAGAPATEDETVALIRDIQVIPLDFQLVPSETEQFAVTRCRDIVQSGTLEDAKRLWEELLKIVHNTRIRGGTIRLPELWTELRKRISLRDHPDFKASWRSLAALTADYRDGIETALPNGIHIARNKDVNDLSDLIASNTISVLYGNSGCGKSALVKSVLDEKFSDWQQVWFGPEQLEIALSELKRASIGLAHKLLDVLKSTTRSQNVLVIDAAERLSPDCGTKTRKLIGELVAATEQPTWHVVLVGQTEAWADSRLQLLSGAPPLPKYLEVQEASTTEVGDALSSTPALSWLILHEDAVAALTNLRALAWVMQAESVFQDQTTTGSISLATIADRLWRFWTSGEPKFQNLLMRLFAKH